MNEIIFNEVNSLRKNGVSQDDILVFLSSKGMSITDAIIHIRALYGISLGDAKKIVASSKPWSKVHEANECLHEVLERIVEKKDD